MKNKNKKRNRGILPKIRKKAAVFLTSEEGKLAKGNAAAAASSVLLLASALSDAHPVEAHQEASDGQAPEHGPSLTGAENADPTHCSHGSHGSHWSHGSHGSHGQW